MDNEPYNPNYFPDPGVHTPVTPDPTRQTGRRGNRQPHPTPVATAANGFGQPRQPGRRGGGAAAGQRPAPPMQQHSLDLEPDPDVSQLASYQDPNFSPAAAQVRAHMSDTPGNYRTRLGNQSMI